MKKLILLIVLIFFINGCSGELKHIKLDEKSDKDWKTEDVNQNDK